MYIKAIAAMILATSFAFPLAVGYEPTIPPAAYSDLQHGWVAGLPSRCLPCMPPAAYSGSQYGVEHTEFRVQSAAFDTVLQYMRDGVAAFDAITPDTTQYADAIHPFVLNATTLEYVADASALHEYGEFEDGLERGSRSLEHILGDIGNNGGTWFEYLSLNPGNGEREFKRVWLQEHDGYLFGAGYFLPDSRAQEVVHQAVKLYADRGSEAFDTITPDEYVTTAALYPFVVDATDPDLPAVAHGAFPDRVGRSATAVINNTSDRPFAEVIDDLNRDGGTWVEYMYINPDTSTDQLKRTWLYKYDNLIFASGYYLPDVRLQTQVEEAIRMYGLDGNDAFGVITPDEPAHTSGSYTFVMDAESLTMAAHGVFPHLVGSKGNYLDAADKPLRAVLDELDEYGNAWVAYVSENPGTRTDQLTRAYLQVYDGYIFGASYSFPDSRAFSQVDDAIYTYRAAPDTAFATITSGALNERDLFPIVTNATDILAHGVQPILVGQKILESNVGYLQGQSLGLSAQLLEYMAAASATAGEDQWFEGVGLNTHASLLQIKNSVVRSYGGLLFFSGYFVTEGGVQSRVDLAIFSYDNNGMAAFDAITPDEPVTTDESYPFVLDAATLEVVAYGASQDMVGTIYDHVLGSGAISKGDILADIEMDGYTWITHTAVNPATGSEQLKRSWLEAKDGYIFGAGYYVPDSNARDATAYMIIIYEHAQHLLSQLRAETDPALVELVVDPITGLDIDGTPSVQWGAITAQTPASDILETLENEQNMWVMYKAVNPLTGEEGERRVWLEMHDGYVFGYGYWA